MKAKKMLCWGMAALAAALSNAALAQYGGGGDGAAGPSAPSGAADPASPPIDATTAPLLAGGYAFAFGNYQKTLSDPVLSGNYGGGILLGVRRDWHAMEAGFTYEVGKDNIQRQTFKLRGLIFPLGSLPTAYVMFGGGMSRFAGYPVPQPQIPVTGYRHFFTGDLTGGLGYMLPFHLHSYDFALRVEAYYQYGDRFIERYTDFQTDLPVSGTFNEVGIHIGLQLPFHRKHPRVAADSAAPVDVVPVGRDAAAAAPPVAAPAAAHGDAGAAAAAPAAGPAPPPPPASDSDTDINSILGGAPAPK